MRSRQLVGVSVSVWLALFAALPHAALGQIGLPEKARRSAASPVPSEAKSPVKPPDQAAPPVTGTEASEAANSAKPSDKTALPVTESTSPTVENSAKPSDKATAPATGASNPEATRNAPVAQNAPTPSTASPAPGSSTPTGGSSAPASGSPTPAIGAPTLNPPTPGSGTVIPDNLLPSGFGSLTPIDDLGQSRPIGPAKPGLAPEYLNPSANPLLTPTRPEEVRLRGIQPITLQQAIELAARNNRTLQVTRLQYNRSRAALREAQAELYPDITAQANVTRSLSASGELSRRAQLSSQEDLPAFLRQPVESEQSSRSFSGTLTLSYDLFTFGGRAARIRSAEQQVRSDQLQVEIQEQQLRLDVSNDYYDLQEADEAVRIQQSAVRNSAASLRDTQALERAGLGTRFDVLRAQVQLANAQQDLTNALALQQQRRRQLAQRLSIAPSIDLAAADPVQAAGTWDISLENSIILAFRNRAELDQFLAQRDLSEQQRRAALAALRPTLSVNAQYQVLDSFSDTLGPADGYSVAAGLRWNLYDGGAAVARANQAQANKEIAETRFADAQNQIRQQVETAYYNLRASLANITTTTQAVAQAREALRLARLRFQAGVGTQTDVINAENDLTRSEGNRVNAILGYNRAFSTLQRSVSNLPTITGTATSPTTTPTDPGSSAPGTTTPVSPSSLPAGTSSPVVPQRE